jgi:N-methylhydantoinase B/oxoprolinase/acetone carboxylase alpha subunit
MKIRGHLLETGGNWVGGIWTQCTKILKKGLKQPLKIGQTNISNEKTMEKMLN